MKATRIARKVVNHTIVRPSRSIYILAIFLCVILIDLASAFCGCIGNPCGVCQKNHRHIHQESVGSKSQALDPQGLFLLVAANSPRKSRGDERPIVKMWRSHLFFHQTSPDAAREYQVLFGAWDRRAAWFIGGR